MRQSVVHMVNTSLKKRISCWLKGDKHKAVDVKEKRVGTSLGSNQKSTQRITSPSQDHIVNITREIGKLRSDLTHFQNLSNEALMPLLPLIELHCNGLSSAIEQCNQIIEQANAHLQVLKNPI